MNWHLLTKASYTLLMALMLYWAWLSMAWNVLTLLWIGPVVIAFPAVVKGSRSSLLYGAFALIIPFCHGLALWLTGSAHVKWALLEASLAALYFTAYYLAFRSTNQVSR